MKVRFEVWCRTAVPIAAFFVLLSVPLRMAAQSELSYVEDGVLHYSTTVHGTTDQQTIPNVLRVLNYNSETHHLLYLAAMQVAGGTDAVNGGDLVLFDTTSQSTVHVASDVITGALSPDGTKVALWHKDNEIRIVAPNGATLQKIGLHGAAPVFSHDGNVLAYEKLGDISPDGNPQSMFELAQGIAIYDLRTGQERLVTSGGMDDFAPVGFSRDMRKLFFNSTRPFADSPGKHVASLWVVDLNTGKTERLTNINEEEVKANKLAPVVNENALWTTDRRTIISSNNTREGVWVFTLSRDGALISAARVGDGDSPQWLVRDKTIVFRTATASGKSSWQQFDIR